MRAIIFLVKEFHFPHSERKFMKQWHIPFDIKGGEERMLVFAFLLLPSSLFANT